MVIALIGSLFARLTLPQWLRGALPYIGGAALVLAILWALWARGDHWRDKYQAASARIEAGKLNLARLMIEKAAIEKRQAAITGRIDDETKPARETALAAADRYSRANRCVRSTGPVSAASGAGDVVSGPASAAGGVEASPAAAELVAVSRADIDACTLNTVNYGLAVAWARATGE